MIQTKPWAERRFAFDTPVWQFPLLLERLRGTPARLEDRLRDLPAETLRRRDGDTWSIQENAGHLLQVETLWFRRLEDYDAGRAELRAADMENRATKGASYNEQPLPAILAAFRASREKLLAALEALDEAGAERTAHHPRLHRPMRVIDMVYFAAEHDDYHLARISELRRKFAAGE